MSIYGMKPVFTSAETYKLWKRDRARLINNAARICKARKAAVRDAQRTGDPELLAKARASYARDRVIAHKLNSLMEDGKVRRDNLLVIRDSLAEQQKTFPLTLENCRVIDFHFNKKHLEIPSIPMWVAKTRGKVYYINHIDCRMPWSTMERDEGATRGMIRVRHADLLIDKSGIAHATPRK